MVCPPWLSFSSMHKANNGHLPGNALLKLLTVFMVDASGSNH